MNKQKQRVIERMKALQELIPATIKALDDLPDIVGGDLYTTLEPGELRIALPYKPTEYLSTRRALAKSWKHTGHRFNEYTGNYYVYFQHRTLDVKLSLELEISSEFEAGASCKLVEIGYETETIYGLECK